MKQKSDKKKLQEQRCIGSGSEYVAFIKANEAKSIGTATQIYDPVAKRTVDVLSVGEEEFFWILRFDDNVLEIQEQMVMASEYVNSICIKNGFARPKHLLSTDFLVTYQNGSQIAYSIKASREEFDPKNDKYWNNPKRLIQLLERQTIEMEYWKLHGVKFKIVFKEDMNHVFSRNIANVMKYYNEKYVTEDKVDRLKYLIAHKQIAVDMETEPLPFLKLANTYKQEIEAKSGGLCNERK